MNKPADSRDEAVLDIELADGRMRVRGEVDARSAAALATALRDANGSIDLDLAEVGFVDSSGLRVLIEAHQLLDARGDALVIVDPSPAVQRMFELSSLRDYLTIRHR